jgi:hypothetical protein
MKRNPQVIAFMTPFPTRSMSMRRSPKRMR